VRLKTEADGRIFPITDSSETIINCLMQTAEKAGVKLLTGVGVKGVKQFTEANKNYFQVELKNGQLFQCDRLLIATGSNPLGYRWATNLGHTIESPVPSLFTFNIKDPRLQGLAGVSVNQAQVRLGTGKNKLEQTGALLITHWGVSGPGILKLSAWGARFLYDLKYNSSLQINWLPEYNYESLTQDLIAAKETNPKKKIVNYCPLNLPKRLWQSLVAYVGIQSNKVWSEINKKELNKLVGEIIQGQYQITGKGVFKEEFVTCGGVNLKEINFKTMESKKCPGLYFAGEILDIDGVTGGFNFQSAWTTSWLAGQAIAID
jgi:predicted Rossmann fold flavoprotein